MSDEQCPNCKGKCCSSWREVFEGYKAEVDHLKSEVERLTNMILDRDMVTSREMSLETEVEKLKASLREYGRHRPGCGYNYPGYEGPDCKCGWGEVQKQLEE